MYFLFIIEYFPRIIFSCVIKKIDDLNDLKETTIPSFSEPKSVEDAFMT